MMINFIYLATGTHGQFFIFILLFFFLCYFSCYFSAMNAHSSLRMVLVCFSMVWSLRRLLTVGLLDHLLLYYAIMNSDLVNGTGPSCFKLETIQTPEKKKHLCIPSVVFKRQ